MKEKRKSTLYIKALIILYYVLITCPVHLTAQEPTKLAPYLPTHMKIVKKMLDLAEVDEDDIVYDIGCGDGRIVITAAEEYGAQGVGIEYDSTLAAEAQKNVEEKGLEDKVKILHQDAFTVDLSPATVVTLYLTTTGNELLKPNLEKYLKRGTRIVSHDFSIPEWKYKKRRITKTKMFIGRLHSELINRESILYLYIMGKHK